LDGYPHPARHRRRHGARLHPPPARLVGSLRPARRGRRQAPLPLLARLDEDGLRFAGGAFLALKAPQREALGQRIARLGADRSPIRALRKRDARWLKPELVVRRAPSAG
jgi:hypothetical protein